MGVGARDGLRPRRTAPVSLDALVGSAPPVPVTGVTLDTRLVEPGDLFVGLPGRNHHGAVFAAQAAEAGAVALLTDAVGAGPSTPPSTGALPLPAAGAGAHNPASARPLATTGGVPR